jgi:hypothetical protein
LNEPTDGTLTGNWLVTGSLPNWGPQALSKQQPSSFGLVLSLDVVGGQVIANQSLIYTCGNIGGGTAGYLTTADIASDGSFTLQTPTQGVQPTITFAVQGMVPQTTAGTWSGTYGAADSNVGCSPVSGTFTAVPIQPVTGTFAGSETWNLGSGGTPVNVSVVLQQGATNFTPTISGINSQNVLSGSIAVQGTSCFTSGTLTLGEGAVYGGFVQGQFAMNDGSSLHFDGAIDDAAVSKISLVSALVVGGQCDKEFITGSSDLVRQ